VLHVASIRTVNVWVGIAGSARKKIPSPAKNVQHAAAAAAVRQSGPIGA
jgi:hypothetical protein